MGSYSLGGGAEPPGVLQLNTIFLYNIKMEFFNRTIYACVESNKSGNSDWLCKKFNSYKDADNHYTGNNKSILIPIHFTWPEFIHKILLINAIRKEFVKVTIKK